MFKNFCPEALGISGRQSELIELALTYGFRGMDLDMLDLTKRAAHRGAEHAKRYLDSAKIKIGGWELPVHIQADEATFNKELEQLAKVAEVARSIGATVCHTTISPASADVAYHENFELHRKRLTKAADVLQPFGVKLGLGFLAPAYHRANITNPFIHQAEVLLLLVRTVGVKNVGVVVDLWHWHVAKAPLDQLKDVKVDQILSVRLADCPADADLDLITEKQRMLPSSGGAIDSVAALTYLAKLGFDGPVSTYPHPSQFHGTTRDSICKKAGESLESVFRDAGINRPVPAPAAPARAVAAPAVAAAR